MGVYSIKSLLLVSSTSIDLANVKLVRISSIRFWAKIRVECLLESESRVTARGPRRRRSGLPTILIIHKCLAPRGCG